MYSNSSHLLDFCLYFIDGTLRMSLTVDEVERFVEVVALEFIKELFVLLRVLVLVVLMLSLLMVLLVMVMLLLVDNEQVEIEERV